MRGLQPTSLALLGLLVVAGLVFFRLHTLLPNLSDGELATRVSASSLHQIVSNPVNAPYTILVYLLLKLHYHGPLALRSVGALYGILTAGLFFYILRRWQNLLIALFGTTLFATSTWFLNIARAGTPEIMQFGLVALVAAGLWLRDGHHRRLAMYTSGLALALAIYVPGLVWFALLGLVWRRKVVFQELRYVQWWLIAIGAGGLVLLAGPLARAVYLQHSLALTLLGLPQKIPHLSSIGHNLTNIPRFLFVYGPNLPAQWLGHTAILDVFGIAMFALGIYAEIRFVQHDRARLLLGILVVGSILLGLGGPVTISLLMPFAYLIIAAGITYLLYEWFKVFPFNPVARGLGIGLIALAIAMSATYQLDRYFIAWAHSPMTHTEYNHPS